MDSNRLQLAVVRSQLRELWTRLRDYWGLKQRHLQAGQLDLSGLNDLELAGLNRDLDDVSETKSDSVIRPYCYHSNLRKAVASIFQRLHGPDLPARIDGLCPICGLLPKGDRAVEYVLRVWFTDGDIYEYTYKCKDAERCYRMRDGILEISLGDSVLTYSLEHVSTVHFGPREVESDPPEVQEAERILADYQQRDNK